MSYNYNTTLVSFANNLVISTTDVNFQTMFPNAIDDAEQRLYRDLDLLNTVVNDSSSQFVTGTRTFVLPSSNGIFEVINEFYAITPVGTSSPDAGTRNPLIPASRAYLDNAFPSATASGVPKYFAMTTQTSVIVGPWPDQQYQAEVSGTIRPAPMSLGNPTTLLSQYFPDLWMAGLMIFGAAYQQNFGASSDNPQMAQSWENHYQTIIKSAQVEEARKKFTSEGWSSRVPAALATPPRT